jgi:hypothetical protein
MGEKARRVELRTGQGEVILSLILFEEEITQEDNLKNEPALGQGGNENKEPSASNDSAMTEAQKRYLFRILAEHGIQGEMAHQELKNAFRVNALTEVGKFEASKLIERLLVNGKGGLKNGSSIQ